MTLFWIGFHLFILAIVSLDLKGSKNPLGAVIFHIMLALGFNIFVGVFFGKESALTFFTAYLVETSLSIDNLFVFFTIFSFFGIAKDDQRKVLLWGVIGAFISRVIFIFLGITLLRTFFWMNFVFGAILCISAMYLWKSKEINIQNSMFFSFIKKCFFVYKGEHRGRFFVTYGKKIYVTSLFLALLFIEAFDLLFAIDSIPAVLSITKDPFLAYTSNVFAVLGLRSFYLLLVKVEEKIKYLKPAISSILLFIGLKMFFSYFIHISNLLSLIIVISLLSFFILLSKLKK